MEKKLVQIFFSKFYRNEIFYETQILVKLFMIVSNIDTLRKYQLYVKQIFALSSCS